jgi:protein-disulfide isomerase
MDSTQKRVLFWFLFIVVIGLIVWVVWSNYSAKNTAAATSNAPVVKLLNPVTSSDHTLGSPSAPVTLVEYADFECPACQAYEPVIEQLLKDEGSKVYFAYRYFPLPQHPNAVPAAKAAEAAGLQGKFWQMHDMLFADNAQWENLSDPSSVFVGYAKTLGLNTTQFSKDYASAAVAATINADLAQANANQLTYTPTLFVNGVRIDNPTSYAAFRALIDAAAGGTSASTTTVTGSTVIATSTTAAQ